jgi:RNA polymerase sigma factor (sigma-70 family)
LQSPSAPPSGILFSLQRGLINQIIKANTDSRDSRMHSQSAPAQPGSGIFATTLWSVVLQASAAETTAAGNALQYLCEAYWYPLYGYVRRQGHGPEDAEDLTQEFFARMLERKYLRLADQKRGRFRTFLLTSLKHFLINEWTKANRAKRGGGNKVLSLDAEQTETRFLAEAADGRSPDKAFDRRWAMIVLDRALNRIEREFVSDGRAALFTHLKSSLSGEETESSYADIARQVGMSKENVKMTAHRLRRRYHDLLREEIGRTVDTASAIDAEMQDLMAALSD